MKRHQVKKELEITSTGSGEAYSTPYAFTNNEYDKNKKERMKRLGYKRVPNDVLKKNFVKEDISARQEEEIREMIRQEIALIFFDLFKKRNTWM
jgi:hypothetical protein